MTDFGLSRVLGDLASHVSTRTYGTISFMPPELIRDAKLSKAADVYSYGILMWETYCSKTAYDGTPAATVLPPSTPSSPSLLLRLPSCFGFAPMFYQHHSLNPCPPTSHPLPLEQIFDTHIAGRTLVVPRPAHGRDRSLLMERLLACRAADGAHHCKIFEASTTKWMAGGLLVTKEACPL